MIPTSCWHRCYSFVSNAVRQWQIELFFFSRLISCMNDKQKKYETSKNNETKRDTRFIAFSTNKLLLLCTFVFAHRMRTNLVQMQIFKQKQICSTDRLTFSACALCQIKSFCRKHFDLSYCSSCLRSVPNKKKAPKWKMTNSFWQKWTSRERKKVVADGGAHWTATKLSFSSSFRATMTTVHISRPTKTTKKKHRNFEKVKPFIVPSFSCVFFSLSSFV